MSVPPPRFTALSPESPLVLGSGSPRRREILARAKVPFVVIVGDADEQVLVGEPVADYLARVVLAKLAAVRARAGQRQGGAILVADTSVVLGDGASALGVGTPRSRGEAGSERGPRATPETILGKPADEAEALRMIERLSARTHEVRTRYALAEAWGSAPPLVAETVVTRVTFRAITPDEARAYVASGEGRDKAGGYAVQGGAGPFVARIDGSYSNVVGLPEDEVVAALRSFALLPAS